jgi:hypothetical protein
MFRCAAARFNGDTLLFKLYVRNHNRERLDRRDPATLKAVCGPGDTPEPVITIMLPDEDGDPKRRIKPLETNHGDAH